MLNKILAGPVRIGLGTLPIFVNKLPLFHGLKLIFVMPLIGLLQLVGTRRIAPQFWWFVAMLAWGMVLAGWTGHTDSFIRLIQVFLMIGFGEYLLEHFQLEDFLRFEKALLVCALIYLIGEYMWQGFIPGKEFIPGWHIQRLEGIVGESNYSGLLCAVVTISLWLHRPSYWSIVGFVAVAMTGSRVGVVVFVIGHLWPVIKRIPTRAAQCIYRGMLVLIILYPLLLTGLERALELPQQQQVNRVYNGRFIIHMSYLEMFKSNWWGVGFFRGTEQFKNYATVGSKLIESGFVYPIDHEPNFQQHGIMIQILTEFGAPGYILWAIFLWKLFRKALASSMAASHGLICYLLGALTLNVLSDFTLVYAITRFSLLSDFVQHEDSSSERTVRS